MTAKITERAVLLGSRESLVGILTRAAAAASHPTVVILNTGIIHRVGHHRMFVTMSRALAAAGYPVLRFDFSGIGDSDPRNDGLSPLESCMADIKDALDWLERDCQASRVVLVGLCSGADHAVLYGHTDDRVAGIVLMDPSVPATLRYYVQYVTQRLTQARSWASVLTGRSRTAQMWLRHARDVVRSAWTSQHGLRRRSLLRETVEPHYKKSVDKNLPILAIFTEERTRQTYREQILDAFPNVAFGDKMRLEFFSGSDHTFINEADRSRLTRLVLQWVGALHAAI